MNAYRRYFVDNIKIKQMSVRKYRLLNFCFKPSLHDMPGAKSIEEHW